MYQTIGTFGNYVTCVQNEEFCRLLQFFLKNTEAALWCITDQLYLKQ